VGRGGEEGNGISGKKFTRLPQICEVQKINFAVSGYIYKILEAKTSAKYVSRKVFLNLEVSEKIIKT